MKIKVVSRITPMGLVIHEYSLKSDEGIFYQDEGLNIPCESAMNIINNHTNELNRRFSQSEKTGLITTKDTI